MPLAHILLPQLLRKTNEIQAALEPASPPLAGAGYLQQTGADSGNIPKNAKVDPTTPAGAAITAMSSLRKAGPEYATVADAATRSATRFADPALQLIPNAPGRGPIGISSPRARRGS